MSESCIVAIGGGGFGSDPTNPLLEDYLLSLVDKPLAKICFVPTASGDADSYVTKFYRAFAGGRSTASHLALFQRSVVDLRSFILEQDIVYVGGGNTANMLAVWRVHGLIDILREAWEQGIVLCGVSAGSICWFESGVTDSFGQALAPLSCMGFLPGSNCPHYDGEAARRPTYERLVGQGQLPPGLAADDGAALRFAGTELAEIVSSRPLARAWRLSAAAGEAIEEELTPRYLG